MKTLVVVADLQVGHNLGIMPEEYERHDGQTVRASRFQKALFRAWREISHDWAVPDYLILNGDIIEGQQYKNRGVEVWTTNMWDQIEAAVELVKMWKAKRIFVIRGTDYHTTLDGNPLDLLLSQKLGAYQPQDFTKMPLWELYLRPKDDAERSWWFHFAHHISGSRSGWMYQTTPIAKEMLLMKLNEERKQCQADIIVRSHVHYLASAHFKSHMGITTPSWQLPTWYAYKRGTGDLVPQIGALRFFIDGDRHPDFPFPDFQQRIYDLPDVKPPIVKE